MLVEESVHVNFDESNQDMQDRSKTGEDIGIPSVQQIGTRLENQTEETSMLP